MSSQTTKEPARNTDLHSLWEPIQDRVSRLLTAMTRRGFDPIIFEALRSEWRQKWLYGVGRTHDLKRKPVTWTMHSKHLAGKAVDIVSKKHLWDYPEFYDALAEEAEKVQLHVIPNERCHCEWQG